MAEPTRPGEALRDLLAERGWLQKDLAEVIDRPQQWVSEVISGKKAITVESADQLGVAFGTGPGFWLVRQDQYRLWVLARDEGHKRRLAEIQRRADQQGDRTIQAGDGSE
jgi:HTH-type transcriptional regulator/antitoxin HigA